MAASAHHPLVEIDIELLLRFQNSHLQKKPE